MALVKTLYQKKESEVTAMLREHHYKGIMKDWIKYEAEQSKKQKQKVREIFKQAIK